MLALCECMGYRNKNIGSDVFSMLSFQLFFNFVQCQLTYIEIKILKCSSLLLLLKSVLLSLNVPFHPFTYLIAIDSFL